MALQIPTRDELHDDFIDAHRETMPEQDSSRGSNPYRLGRVVSGVVWSLASVFKFVLKQFLPDSAKGEFLQRWGNLYKFFKQGPSTSQGVQALRCTGTDGAIVTVGAELAHADGTLYEVAAPIAGDWVIAGGHVDVSVASTTKGKAANKDAGEELTFTLPPLNVDPVSTLIGNLRGGADNEDEEPYRTRLVNHIADPPQGGAIPDYVEWGGKVAGVHEVFVYQHRRRLGTMDVAVLQKGHGVERIIADVTPVQTFIDKLKPGGIKDVLVVILTAQPQDVTVDILIDETTYEWDWQDGGVGYAVTAFDEPTKTITVPTAPATVIAGRRLTIGGEEAKVVTRAGDVLTLAFSAPNDDDPAPSWFSFDITGSEIRCSGDLVVPVRNAILALFDQLGPARGSLGFAAMPWEDSLRIAKALGAAVDSVRGVIDSALTTPFANVTPADPYETDPDDLTLPLLVPGKVQVLRRFP